MKSHSPSDGEGVPNSAPRSSGAGHDKLSLRELIFLSMAGGMIFAAKMALVAFPNVHLNAVIMILLTIFFRWKAFLAVMVYIMLEGMTFGFGLWWFCYWYLWPLLIALAMLFRNNRSVLLWAALAGIHGLCFGALCSVPYVFLGGWRTAFAMWISGIPYDIVHCTGNFVFTLVLYKPLYALMERFVPRLRN